MSSSLSTSSALENESEIKINLLKEKQHNINQRVSENEREIILLKEQKHINTKVCFDLNGMVLENEGEIKLLKEEHQNINKKVFFDLDHDVKLIRIQNEHLQNKYLEIKKENVENYGIVDEKLKQLQKLIYDLNNKSYLVSRGDYFELHAYKIDKLGKLIGKKSENLKTIESIYNIRIKIPFRNEQKNKKPIKIYPNESTNIKHMMYGIQHVQNIVG